MKIITDLSAMHRTIGNLLSRQRTVPCVTCRRYIRCGIGQKSALYLNLFYQSQNRPLIDISA